VCERRQDGRQQIGVANVEGGSASGGAFNKPTGPEALAGPAGAARQNKFGPVKRESVSGFCGEERRCHGWFLLGCTRLWNSEPARTGNKKVRRELARLAPFRTGTETVIGGLRRLGAARRRGRE